MSETFVRVACRCRESWEDPLDEVWVQPFERFERFEGVEIQMIFRKSDLLKTGAKDLV